MVRQYIATWIVMIAAVAAGPALADDPGRWRLEEALGITDRRIEAASSLLSGTPNAPAIARTELAVAQDLQSRAKSAFAANQALISMRQTMEARTHADRAIALVRGLPDPGRVRDQVERTRDILERAGDRLQRCEVVRSRALMRVAVEMQQRAEDRLAMSMYLGALQLTMSARERVLKAMRLCHMDESLADAAERALQRTDEVIARALEEVDADSPPTARDALARARSIQTQAHDEARLEHYESALRLTQDARAIAARALRPGRGIRDRTR